MELMLAIKNNKVASFLQETHFFELFEYAANSKLIESKPIVSCYVISYHALKFI